MYDFEFYPQKPITTSILKERAARVLAVKSVKDLAQMLAIDTQRLMTICQSPSYSRFSTPKKDGSVRMIEAPASDLKAVQSSFSSHLQGFYYQIKPPSAYGFLPVPTDEAHPRHIYTNAMRHIGAKWLLNIDLKDFFHQIQEERLVALFTSSVFEWPHEVAQLATRLVTIGGRLPMGAPSSPVLSNLVCLWLDHDLEVYAQERGWAYTRYADDLSFSSAYRMRGSDKTALFQIIEGVHKLKVNTRKVAVRSTKEDAEVTGLVLGKKSPEVSGEFVARLKEEVKLLEFLLKGGNESWRTIVPPDALTKLLHCIKGKMAFFSKICGQDDALYQRLQKRLAMLASPA